MPSSTHSLKLCSEERERNMLEQRCTVGEIKKERKEDERRDENEEEGIINERKKKRCWKVARFEKEKKKKNITRSLENYSRTLVG